MHRIHTNPISRILQSTPILSETGQYHNKIDASDLDFISRFPLFFRLPPAAGNFFQLTFFLKFTTNPLRLPDFVRMI